MLAKMSHFNILFNLKVNEILFNLTLSQSIIKKNIGQHVKYDSNNECRKPIPQMGCYMIKIIHLKHQAKVFGQIYHTYS